jgi:hypothetical protein
MGRALRERGETMPLDTTSQTALVVIAIAASLQTALLLAGAIGAFVAWRRANAMLERRLDAFDAKLDEFSQHARQAADAVDRFSSHAGNALHSAGSVVRTVASAVSAPRTMLMAGAASALGGVLSRWRHGKRPAKAGGASIRSIR